MTQYHRLIAKATVEFGFAMWYAAGGCRLQRRGRSSADVVILSMGIGKRDENIEFLAFFSWVSA